MAPIAILADDILIEIFKIHVYENEDTPHRLLRVNHHWYQITTTTGFLWGNLFWYSGKAALKQAKKARGEQVLY